MKVKEKKKKVSKLADLLRLMLVPSTLASVVQRRHQPNLPLNALEQHKVPVDRVL